LSLRQNVKSRSDKLEIQSKATKGEGKGLVKMDAMILPPSKILLTADAFSLGLEPFTEEKDVKRVKEFLAKNWRKSEASLYTRPINNQIHIVINVHPKYEKLLNECLMKWKKEQGWTLPIIIEAFNDDDVGYLHLNLRSAWRFW